LRAVLLLGSRQESTPAGPCWPCPERLTHDLQTCIYPHCVVSNASKTGPTDQVCLAIAAKAPSLYLGPYLAAPNPHCARLLFRHFLFFNCGGARSPRDTMGLCGCLCSISPHHHVHPPHHELVASHSTHCIGQVTCRTSTPHAQWLLWPGLLGFPMFSSSSLARPGRALPNILGQFVLIEQAGGPRLPLPAAPSLK